MCISVKRLAFTITSPLLTAGESEHCFLAKLEEDDASTYYYLSSHLSVFR